MTITLFLAICLGCILSLWLLPGHGRRAGNSRYTLREAWFYGAWLLMGMAAFWMVNRYTYPANKDAVFGNSDYHFAAA